MKRCISSSRRISLAVIATGLIVASGSVFAQTVDEVLQAEDRRLNLAQQSQERINQIVEGTRSLEDQYRAINKEIDGLKVYNRLMTAQVGGQEAVLEDISLSMDQVDVINRQIFPLMERMIDGLDQSVKLDVPFLMESAALVCTSSRPMHRFQGAGITMRAPGFAMTLRVAKSARAFVSPGNRLHRNSLSSRYQQQRGVIK